MILRNISLKRLSSRGVTLVEMLIVMGLLSMFLVILTTLFTATLDSQTQTEAYSSVISEGRYLIARLNYDISQASSVATPSSLGVQDSSLTLLHNGQSYEYNIVDDALILADPAGSAALSSTSVSVSDFQITRIGNSGGKDTVRFSFTLTSKAHVNSGDQSQTFTSTAELR